MNLLFTHLKTEIINYVNILFIYILLINLYFTMIINLSKFGKLYTFIYIVCPTMCILCSILYYGID